MAVDVTLYRYTDDGMKGITSAGGIAEGLAMPRPRSAA
jgi:hypothetical protein